MNVKIITSFLFFIFLFLGCSKPYFNFKVKKMDTCIIDKVQAPKWICKGDYQTKDAYYIVSVLKSKKVTKWKKSGKIGSIKIYTKEKEPINRKSFLFVDYYQYKALLKAQDKLYKKYKANVTNKGKIISWWNSPLDDYYTLVKFKK